MYKYRDLTKEGFKQVFISKKCHNDLFPNRQIKWHNRYEYYLSEKMIHMERYTTLFAKLLMMLILPISYIWYGMANYKQLNKEVYNIWHEKERGSFSNDVIYCYEKNQRIFAAFKNIY